MDLTKQDVIEMLENEYDDMNSRARPLSEMRYINELIGLVGRARCENFNGIRPARDLVHVNKGDIGEVIVRDYLTKNSRASIKLANSKGFDGRKDGKTYEVKTYCVNSPTPLEKARDTYFLTMDGLYFLTKEESEKLIGVRLGLTRIREFTRLQEDSDNLQLTLLD